MDNIIKQGFAIVTLSVVLVLLLKNAQNTNNVLTGISNAVANDVSVLQGNAYSGASAGLASSPQTLAGL